MTHDELREHRGTVWSYAGFMGLHEYEYLGEGKLPIYGNFRRCDSGRCTDGIQVKSCFPTKRAAIEHCLAGTLEEIRYRQGLIAEMRAELVAMGG